MNEPCLALEIMALHKMKENRNTVGRLYHDREEVTHQHEIARLRKMLGTEGMRDVLHGRQSELMAALQAATLEICERAAREPGTPMNLFVNDEAYDALTDFLPPPSQQENNNDRWRKDGLGRSV